MKVKFVTMQVTDDSVNSVGIDYQFTESEVRKLEMALHAGDVWFKCDSVRDWINLNRVTAIRITR